jgi:hypothetical protein
LAALDTLHQDVATFFLLRLVEAMGRIVVDLDKRERGRKARQGLKVGSCIKRIALLIGQQSPRIFGRSDNL